MVLNAISYNILFPSWWSVLLVVETGFRRKPQYYKSRPKIKPQKTPVSANCTVPIHAYHKVCIVIFGQAIKSDPCLYNLDKTTSNPHF
jgi:hypothetical protein